MHAESVRVMRTEVWTDWEGHVVNGTFPLRRFLGTSNHSAVFLTEYKAQNLGEAAIKFLPAANLHSEAQQLVQWGAVATLSHPHLVRLFDVGRCQLGGHAFLFAVMEYAEQTLAEILPKRPLTPAEVREMLPPMLDALAYLHGNNLAHGHLKPANILVINDQVKLSCDTVRSPGLAGTGIGRAYLYDPPELSTTGFSTAGDVWALGVTLVEALTQRYPVPDERYATALLPTSVPKEFVDIARRCLSRNPANRPNVTDLEAHYKPPLAAPPVLSPAPMEPVVPDVIPAAAESPEGRLWLTAVAVALLAIAALWAVWQFFLGDSRSVLAEIKAAKSVLHAKTESTSPYANGSSDGGEAATTNAGASATPELPLPGTNMGGRASAPDSAPASGNPAANGRSEPSPALDNRPGAGRPMTVAERSRTPGTAPATTDSRYATFPGVVQKIMPAASPEALDKINGHIVVKVRVLVDQSGEVVGQFLESPGPSKYFARISSDAAGEWKFAPSPSRDPRVWLLRFEFDHNGATVEPAAAQ